MIETKMMGVEIKERQGMNLSNQGSWMCEREGESDGWMEIEMKTVRGGETEGMIECLQI